MIVKNLLIAFPIEGKLPETAPWKSSHDFPDFNKLDDIVSALRILLYFFVSYDTAILKSD